MACRKFRTRNGSRHYKASARMAQALSLVAEGMPVRDAATQCGISYQAVMYRLPSDPRFDARQIEREAAEGVGRQPRKPTTARAGSDAKIAVMAARAARGDSLFHPDDEPRTEDPACGRVADDFDRPAMRVVLG